MKTAIYAGSFDPFTNGHLDILKNGAKIFDKVIILVANNPNKNYLLPLETRVDLIRQSAGDITNVEVDCFDGLTVNYAQNHNATTLIRGLRTLSDFEYETQMAKINKSLNSDIDTIFIPATKENDFISSSLIRELLLNKHVISHYVPEAVSKYFSSHPVY